jgi:hypothetical protein
LTVFLRCYKILVIIKLKFTLKYTIYYRLTCMSYTSCWLVFLINRIWINKTLLCKTFIVIINYWLKLKIILVYLLWSLLVGSLLFLILLWMMTSWSIMSMLITIHIIIIKLFLNLGWVIIIKLENIVIMMLFIIWIVIISFILLSRLFYIITFSYWYHSLLWFYLFICWRIVIIVLVIFLILRYI